MLLKKILAAIALFAVIGSTSFAADNPKVKQAMGTLQAETTKLGAPKVDADNLFFGATKMNGNFEIVDAVKTKHSATATIFIKKGTNYTRITTNVMKDGQRAVGSILDPNGPAIVMINQGKAYYGLVDILGKIFDTGYEPIKSASGEVIGILYVGFLAE